LGSEIEAAAGDDRRRFSTGFSPAIGDELDLYLVPPDAK
jgi:hypothetical protein